MIRAICQQDYEKMYDERYLRELLYKAYEVDGQNVRKIIIDREHFSACTTLFITRQ